MYIVSEAEEVVISIEQVTDGAGHLGVAVGDGIVHRVDVVRSGAGEGAFDLYFGMTFRDFAQHGHRCLSALRIACDDEIVAFLHLQVIYQSLGSEVGIERITAVDS